jgi:glucose/arabinose dehydrogenase
MRNALIVAAALLLAACSSSDNTTSTTSAPSVSAPTTTSPPTSSGAAGNPAPATPDLAAVQVKLTPVASLTEPIYVTTRPGDDSTIYIAQRGGQLRAVRGGQLAAPPVLDISKMISSGGERGFLGVTFSPDGSHLYASYTDTAGDSNIDEYAVGADGTVDTATRRQVLFQKQPYPNHNGGDIVFGPDGYLYFGLGDGGSEGDPQREGQNLGTWLSKILRIDPTASGGQSYTVPADNPFVGRAGVKPEIWSYGLRNPWRFSFDSATEDLWIADVGQDTYEEIDHSSAADGAGKGANYGWSAFEGGTPYNKDQSAPNSVMPVYVYQHQGGNCSISGGFVYRGTAIPALRGAYLFSDYCVGGVRAISLQPDGQGSAAVLLSKAPASVSSFGAGPGGELYVCSLGGNTVYRIDPA